MWLLEWIKYNWISIVTFITSANFIAIICMIVKIVLNIRTGKLQNEKLTTLISNLTKLNNTKDSVDKNTSSNEELVNRVLSLETKLAANNQRLGAILDVMGVVYMRSKDEDIRNAVSTILNTLGYKDNEETENLKLQVKDLKEQLNDTVKLLAEQSNNETTDDKVEEQEDETIIRG